MMISTTLYGKWKQNWGGDVRNKSLWAAFWSKVGGVSIRTKVMGIVAACIIGSAAAVIWYTYNDDLARSREQLQERGIAIGTSIAAQSQDLILTGNQFSLYELIRETGNAYEDINESHEPTYAVGTITMDLEFKPDEPVEEEGEKSV